MRFIDFFAGIGGFRLGMEMAGHECAGHCEIDKFADKSYKAIHKPKESEWYATDIRAVNPGELPEADCWCFGFPCQAFSIAGLRRGFEDMRGTLIFEIFRLAKERKPKLLFAENVAGLLNHDGGRTFRTILNGFRELGYWYEFQVLNSKDFGVPQNRERVFIIGHLGEYSGGEIFPITRTDKETDNGIKIIYHRDCYRRNTQVYDPKGITEALDTGQGGGRGIYIQQGINVGFKAKSQYADIANTIMARDYKGVGNQRITSVEVRAVLTPDREEKRQNGRRFKEPGEPMLALTGQDRHGIEIQNRIRRLTPKECFRLQGFPDEYFERAKTVNSDSQLYKQAGNSVTVNVIYEIAKRL